jgi:hypothetical protein
MRWLIGLASQGCSERQTFADPGLIDWLTGIAIFLKKPNKSGCVGSFLLIFDQLK